MTKSQNTKNEQQKDLCITSEQLTEKWVNIYKSKKHGSYWTGAFCYKTKEEAVKDLADKENYLTTVNIEDMLNLQIQNAQLKEQINKCCLDAINRGTANAIKAVKEFGMPERIKELVEQNKELKDKCERLEKQLKIAKKYLPLIKRNVSVGSLAYTYVANAQTEIKELEKC